MTIRWCTCTRIIVRAWANGRSWSLSWIQDGLCVVERFALLLPRRCLPKENSRARRETGSRSTTNFFLYFFFLLSLCREVCNVCYPKSGMKSNEERNETAIERQERSGEKKGSKASPFSLFTSNRDGNENE